MKAREDAARAGMQLERLVDGHLRCKLLLAPCYRFLFATTRRRPAGCELACEVDAEYACKPDSVPTSAAVTISLGRALPSASVRCCSFGRAVRLCENRAILLQVGFTRARVTADAP